MENILSFKMEENLEGSKLIINQYSYLKSCLTKKGQLIDKQLKSPLNFQYHYTSFILSSILLKDYENIEKVLNYYLSIPKYIRKPSNDFNILLLSFAIMFDDDKTLDRSKILKTFYHNSNDYLYKLNNNFRALRLVGMILESKIKNIGFDQKIKDEIEWILDLQFDDGFFSDSNMEYKIEKNRGVPHLTYHTKIMMCIGLAYLYTKDERLKGSFFKALQVLIEISIESYYFFYGRSTNALFGYGCLYLVFILAYKFSSNRFFLGKAKKILLFLKDYQHKDGHISINLNKNDSKRFGFDGYMYDIVYNAYSNALFLLGNKFLDDLEFEQYAFQLNYSKIKIYKNSGFVVYDDKNTKYCLNFKGHQNSLKHRFDSRVSPFSLLYFQKNNYNLLPAVGFYPQPILNLVENKFTFSYILQRIKNIYWRIFYKQYLPLLSGNIFCYLSNNKLFYPFELIRFIKVYDKIIIKFKTKTSKEDIFDECVVSIHLHQNIRYKILFYKQIQRLAYSLRDEEEENFKYGFNKKYNRKKEIKIETSSGIGKLKIYEFKDIKNIEFL